MDLADVESFSNDTCLLYARRIVDDLSHVMSLPEVGEALRQRLQNVTALEARDLVDAWCQMSCRNANLIEYSPVLTRLANCNSAPLMLGAGQSAKGAGLYMCKYMVKEAYALAASLSVLLDARQNIAAYPTEAGDSGSDRTTKHFLQRVLNSTASELAPTQAAAMVLGIPSSGHSHTFVYQYIWDAIRLVGVLARGAKLFSDPVAAEAVTISSQADLLADPSKEAAPLNKETDDEDGDTPADHESDGDLDPSAVGTGGRVGAAGVYTIAEGEKVAVAQAEHYALRNPELLD